MSPMQSVRTSTRRPRRLQSRRGIQAIHRADSRRERKKQVTRQRLLQSAWQLFQEKGYDHTTVEDITEAADVAKSTFFNYFDTKNAILDEIALWRIELLGNQVLAADDVPDSAIARIKLVMKAMSDEFSPERELTRHLFMARISAPIKRESAHRLGSLMHELVRQGQARQEIRDDIDAGLIARLLMTCFFHNFAWWHRRDDVHRTGHQAQDPSSADVLHPPEVTLMESVYATYASTDALMDGLGGPEWRKS